MWSETEKDLWVAVSEAVRVLSGRPTLMGKYPFTLETDVFKERLIEIEILWDAWHRLAYLNDSVSKNTGKLAITEGLIRRPQSWTEAEWETYLNIYWRYSQLVITYNHLTQS